MVRQIAHRWLLCVALTFSWHSVAATSLQVRIDKNPVMLGEELQLQIQLDEKVSSAAIDFSPLAEHFNFSAPAVSQSMQIINGQSSQSTSWQLSLFAKATGTFTIPSFSTHGVSSQPIAVEVIPASQSSTDQQELFLQSSLSSTDLYVQQMVYFEVKIFFSGDLQRGSLSQPELANTTIEQVGKDIEGSELVNGKRYQTITRRYSLIPQQSGSYTLQAPMFNGEMIVRNSSRYDYFAKTKTVSAQGQAVTMQVKAMPDGFQGDWLVSELVSLTEEWTPASNQIVQGEPVTRTIILTVVDAADHQLPDLTINLPAGVKSYAEQPQAKQAERNGRLVAQKVFTSAVIANQSGSLELPAIRLPWWNKVTNQLAYAELPARTLQVSTNPNQPPAPEIPAVSTDHPAAVATSPAVLSAWAWTYSTSLMLLLWLVTLFGSALWIYQLYRRPAATKTHIATPLAGAVKFNSRRFKAACLADDATTASEMLLRWASQQLDPDISQLSQLVQHLPDCELNVETQKLAYQAYLPNPQPWQGQKLFEAWAKYKHLSPLAAPTSLQPLYPE